MAYNPTRGKYYSYKIGLYRREMKAKAVAYKGGACQYCGYSRSLKAMDFHHSDPKSKDFNIANGSYGWNKIRKEIDKCELVCISAVENLVK